MIHLCKPTLRKIETGCYTLTYCIKCGEDIKFEEKD